MFTRLRRTTGYFTPKQLADPHTEWNRPRLQLLLGVIAVSALALIAGMVWSLSGVLFGTSTDVSGAQSDHDELAEEALPQMPLEASQPGELSTDVASTLTLPAPTTVGEDGVATGFPQTPEGALAQLAAINTTALTSVSVRVAQDVITNWAVDGGPTPESWSGVKAVASFLESAGMSGEAGTGLALAVEPKMGFIKGTVGEEFVVPCVDFILTLTLPAGQSQQVAAGDCQRMVWRGDRWMIGAGEEPAPAPSVWPGSQASFDVGYQWLAVGSK